MDLLAGKHNPKVPGKDCIVQSLAFPHLRNTHSHRRGDTLPLEYQVDGR